MAIMYVDEEMTARFDAAAAALGRSAEEVPTLALNLLEWFIDQRLHGFELMLGRREYPDAPDDVRLYRVPEIRVVLMDEKGVEIQGVLDVVEPGSKRRTSPDS